MRTIAAVHVLRGVYDTCGIDADNAHTDDFQLIRRALSRRLADAYDFWFWPDLCRIEKRYFRDLWAAGTSYSAPTTTAASEVYFPQSSRYYQALLAMPLAVSSITRSSQTATVTTSSANKLVTGDQVTISGATQTEYNITATITVTSSTTFTYTVAGSPASPATGTPVVNPNPTNATNEVTEAYWAESLNAYSGSNYSASTAYAKGDTAYYPVTDRYYVAHTATTGNLPADTTYWAVLTDFDRYVAYAQTGKTDLTGATILGVYTHSPRLTTQGRDLSFSLSSNGIQVHSPSATCYVEYRQKPPQLKGDNYSASTVYTANISQIYYDGTAQTTATTTEGNFYDCVTTTSAGDTPDSAAAKWSVVSIPADFERYLVHGAAADWWTHEEQWEQAAKEEMLAEKSLGDQKARYVNQSGQRTRTQVMTR